MVRFILGLANKFAFGATLQWRPTEINGRAALLSLAEGDPLTAIAIESDGERITAIYVQRNPDKLARLSRMLDWPPQGGAAGVAGGR